MIGGIIAQRIYKKKSAQRHVLVEPSNDNFDLNEIPRSVVTLPRPSVHSFDTIVEPIDWPAPSPYTARSNSLASLDDDHIQSDDLSADLSIHDAVEERPRSRKIPPPLKLIDFD